MSNSLSNRSLPVAAWVRLVRLHQKIGALSERNFQSLGLNTAWFDVLTRIKLNEGLNQGDLAQALLVTKGNVSQLVAKLGAEGLIERRVEGRSRRLFLTPRGRALADQALPQQESVLKASLESLSLEEQEELIRLLRKWEKT